MKNKNFCPIRKSNAHDCTVCSCKQQCTETEIAGAMTDEQARAVVTFLSTPREQDKNILPEMSTEALRFIRALCCAELRSRGG